VQRRLEKNEVSRNGHRPRGLDGPGRGLVIREQFAAGNVKEISHGHGLATHRYSQQEVKMVATEERACACEKRGVEEWSSTAWPSWACQWTGTCDSRATRCRKCRGDQPPEEWACDSSATHRYSL
jgi:hypothetical protein